MIKLSTILLTILLMSGKCFCQTNYDRKQDIKINDLINRVSILETNATKTASTINIMSKQIIALQDSLTAMKKSIVPYNTLNFQYPLVATKDTIQNTFTIKLNQ